MKDNIVFKGNFENDLINGRGYYFYNNNSGQKYEGIWKMGQKVGIGKMTYPNGDKAEKNWDLGKDSDITYYFNSGEIYKGGFANDQRNGYGIFYNKKGSKSYEGEWKDDFPHGEGKLFYDNGDYFEGNWENGKRKGKGVFTNLKKMKKFEILTENGVILKMKRIP